MVAGNQNKLRIDPLSSRVRDYGGQGEAGGLTAKNTESAETRVKGVASRGLGELPRGKNRPSSTFIRVIRG